MAKYDPHKIEKKWQKRWLEEKIYEPDLDGAKKPFYNLMMFPYPSAEGLHVGNMYAFTGSDIYGRFKRMQGYDVFEPIGLDGFGIHSENYALKVGTHPSDQAKVSEKRFYAQLHAIGDGFAWNEHLETYDPEYYRWTQWLFVQMWKHDLAYRKKQAVNWCPKDQTVLADEQVENGRCERCGTVVEKRELEQWFLRITHYAEQLLNNIPKLKWSEKVKIAQTNWIGRSEGAEIEFKIKNTDQSIKVFTTRPDTLFGATYLVLAPEHPFIESLEDKIGNFKEVQEYVKISAAKSTEERLAEGKGKTGIVLRGIVAINPANGEEIPVWIADYVLGSYGTGAIMAVPAHDERDFAFAKKFGLPVVVVIEPETGEKKPDEQFRKSIVAVVEDPKTKKFLALNWRDGGGELFVGGGIETGEDPVQAAVREIREETGYRNVKLVAQSELMHHHYFAFSKKVQRGIDVTGFYFQLSDDAREDAKLEEQERGKFTVEWITQEEVLRSVKDESHDLIFRRLVLNEIYAGTGYLMNSGEFSGMDSETAKWEIVKFVHGERKTQYRLRDWLISRQRYWGPPIPMIFCAACAKAEKGEHADMPGWYAVPESELPVKLPHLKDFRPKGTGASPLASSKSFYETKCPACGAAARRETDVSDTFLDSAWYYLRYLSPDDENQPFNKTRVKKWLPVPMYIGGAEHAVLHLLYVRFAAMALHDWGMIDFEEPMAEFRAHGLIIKDGTKMSKSKGNIINPDEYITKFGADALRMYLMFLAPFEQGGDFRDGGILGVDRFLNRMWRYFEAHTAFLKKNHGNTTTTEPVISDPSMERLLHQSIKKVTDDIAALKYNTAISQLMILLNGLDEETPAGGAFRGFALSVADHENILKLCAPFAPHITEEIWHENFIKKESIHVSLWPAYDPALIKEDTVTLVVQVNGKVRDTIIADASIDESAAKELALQSEKVKVALAGQEPKRVIYVAKKLINIVI